MGKRARKRVVQTPAGRRILYTTPWGGIAMGPHPDDVLSDDDNSMLSREKFDDHMRSLCPIPGTEHIDHTARFASVALGRVEDSGDCFKSPR